MLRHDAICIRACRRQEDLATNILIIDDDRELGEMLGEYLAPDHLKLSACHSGEDGLHTLRNGKFDLLILDIMLPGMSGLDVLKDIRKTSDIPVIMLTARGEDIDRILGLEFGADDYIAKPFNPRELLARLKAILRRSRRDSEDPDRQIAGELELDTRTRNVTAQGNSVRLTGTEFEILSCMIKSQGGVVSREHLSEQALGRRLLPYDRSIDTHISNLRGKLERAGLTDPLIVSQRGVGYRLVPKE
jgi:two-component system response regulator CpxR